MRLLVISESPLERIDGRYFAVDTWLQFVLHIAREEPTTLWTPVRVGNQREPASECWPVEQGSLNIEPHDDYHSFLGYLRLRPFRGGAWKRTARRLLSSHDAVILRLPSPMLPLVAAEARLAGKPMVLMAAGDIETQSDRVMASRGLKRLAYKLIVKFLAAVEKRRGRGAALVYAYSDELAARHAGVGPRLKRFRTPHLSESDFVPALRSSLAS
jgi:hypothetical protein